MAEPKPQPASTVRTHWREALLWAILAAMVFQITENWIRGRTLWHRLDSIEERLQTIHDKTHAVP
jgi:hypothetical protein